MSDTRFDRVGKTGLSETSKMEDEGGGYRWETGYEKTWEAITEDGDGLLEVSVQDVINRHLILFLNFRH